MTKKTQENKQSTTLTAAPRGPAATGGAGATVTLAAPQPAPEPSQAEGGLHVVEWHGYKTTAADGSNVLVEETEVDNVRWVLHANVYARMGEKKPLHPFAQRRAFYNLEDAKRYDGEPGFSVRYNVPSDEARRYCGVA